MNSWHLHQAWRAWFAAALLAAPSAFGAASTPYQGPAWAFCDRPQVLKEAAQVTPQRYPNCDSATVDERIVEAYQPDGTAQCQDECFTKVLTEKGRQDNNVLTEGFLLPYFTVRVAELEIIRPDGTSVPVNLAANTSVSIDESQMQENIYDPNSRVLRVNIPGLQVGDIVHSVVRTTTHRPIIPGQFADLFVFEGPQYILHTSYELRSPPGDPLSHAVIRDPVGRTVAATVRRDPDGSVIRDWQVNDVPRMYDEPAMPPYEMVLQRVLVSTTPSWRDVSRWYWRLSAPHLAAVSPAMKTAVDQLTAGAPDALARMQAIFYYVSRNIRYMGVTPEKNRPGFEPHDVDLTFAKKYGVCRDKAALLVEMLRMAGFKAYPVLINVGSKLDQRVPSPDFNHAIVAVDTGPGRYQLMDPTDEHTRDFLPTYDDNQSYLVCRPAGDDLRTSPVTPADENLLRIRTSGALADDGTLQATTTMDFGGVNGDAYRGAFAEMKPDDRRRFFESRLQRVMPGARLLALRITPENLLDESVPLRAEVRFAAGDMAAFGARQAIVTMPWLGRDFGISNYFLKQAGLAERKYPLIIDSTCGVDERVAVKLAPNYREAVALPTSSSGPGGSVTYRRTFAFEDGSLVGSSLLALDTVEYSPQQYLELKRTLKDVQYDQRKEPVLALAGPAAAQPAAAASAAAAAPVSSDAEILSDDQTLSVANERTATLRVHYRKRILTYAGKITESEVKIPYNPATQEVRLIRAVVTSASGQRQEASRDEVNVMDAGWNSSAKRYTGGKIFVDSLPGVEIGSTIDVEYEIVSHDQPFLAGFQSFQLPDQVDRKTFAIAAPPGVSVHTRETGRAGIVSQAAAAGPSQIWRASNVAAVPQEPDLPPDWIYEAGVDYFVGDPAARLAAVNRAMVRRAGEDEHAAAVARRLTAGAKSPEDALRAIRDYISRNVRVAGPSFTELPLSELSAADTTLAEGYGHLADCAILYYAMVKAAGFQPTFLLASDLPPVPGIAGVAKSFPFLDAFQAPLVSVTVDGTPYYLNDTDQYAELGSTAHDDRLAIDPADGAYRTVLAAKGCRSGIETTYAVELADTGDARIRIDRRFYGMNYAQEHKRFAELRPEEKALYYQQAVSEVAQGARPVSPLLTRFDTYPGREEFTVSIDRYGIADGRFLYFNLPFTPRLLATETEQRTLPLLASADQDNAFRAVVTLPPGYRTVDIAPARKRMAGPDGAGSVRVTPASFGDQWAVTYQLDSRPAMIPPEDYPKALKLESALENQAARELLLEGPASGSQTAADGSGAPAGRAGG